MARVLLENITKVFDGGSVAVSGFDLEAADGELMVIVGPSGCGKTTTLRIIAGLEEATSGSIYIGDSRVNDVPPKDRDIAMVFQTYALYPHMTAYQNMAFALKMRKVPAVEIDKRIRQAAVLLGIEQLLGRKPRALSGGQRQRVAVGRAIVRNPNVFLFDEPLSNLDAALRLTMRAELKDLHRRLRTTTIYVTHDQAEAMSLGDRICVMREGMVQQTAAPLEVYEQPANKFVAGFLGTPPMNFLAGRIEAEEGKPLFVIGGDRIRLPQRLGGILPGHCGREVVLGIRPEHISFEPPAAGPGNPVSASVGLIEHAGAHTELHLITHTGQKLIATAGPHTGLRVNEAVKVYFDMEKIHIFESGQTGRNVTLPCACSGRGG